MTEGKEKREEAVLVRDKAGNFYRIPASTPSYAISDSKELEEATKEWSSKEGDVEGQWWKVPGWQHPWHRPTGGIRG